MIERQQYTFRNTQVTRGWRTLFITNQAAFRYGRPFILTYFGLLATQMLVLNAGVVVHNGFTPTLADVGWQRLLIAALLALGAISVTAYCAFVRRAIYNGWHRFGGGTIDTGKLAIITGIMYILLAPAPIVAVILASQPGLQ